MQDLKDLNQIIYSDLEKDNRKQYRNYAQQLTQLLVHQKDKPENRKLFAIAFYNLSKLSNRFRFLHTALQFMDPGVLRCKYNLQMLALASSKNNHNQAYSQACKLIDHLLSLIDALNLNKQLQMFAREINQLIHRPKSVNIYSVTSLNELQMTRKFQTNCIYVNKKFHIADIMIMEPIHPYIPQSFSVQGDNNIFFYYIVFLSIACFTRATQKFYCRESSDRDFHVKAIQIAGYLYSDKSTYLRFLKRTYKQHYLEHLDQIQEVDEYGELRVLVPPDPEEVSMLKMPWQEEQEELQVIYFVDTSQQQLHNKQIAVNQSEAKKIKQSNDIGQQKVQIKKQIYSQQLQEKNRLKESLQLQNFQKSQKQPSLLKQQELNKQIQVQDRQDLQQLQQIIQVKQFKVQSLQQSKKQQNKQNTVCEINQFKLQNSQISRSQKQEGESKIKESVKIEQLKQNGNNQQGKQSKQEQEQIFKQVCSVNSIQIMEQQNKT